MKKALLVLLMTIGMFWVSINSLFANGQNESPSDDNDVTVETSVPMTGGSLRLVWQPMNTLDVHWTGSDPVWQLGYHIFETVLALDEKSQPIPNLCSWEYQDGQTTLILHVRQGVLFQDGTEMKAEDVNASLKRWLSKSSFAKLAFKNLKDLEVLDEYTIKMTLSQPSPTALTALAFQDQGPYVMPKYVLDEAGNASVKKYIGTGPYKLAEWSPDRYIKLERFEDYCGLDGEPKGYGGAKKQYLDSMYWIVVKDAMTQIQALTSGDCKVGVYSATQLDQFKGYDNLVIEPTGERASMSITFNLKQGIMTNINMRRAVLSALDMNQVMYAACGGKEEFYDCNPGWGPEKTIWENNIGSDVYNKQDLQKVKQYLNAAGYKGEPIVFYGNNSTDSDKNAAMVVAEQLKQAGMNIDLRIVDWATLTQVRTDPTAYNMWCNGYTIKPDPALIAFVGNSWPGWWNTDTKNALLNNLMTEANQEKRVEAWHAFCNLIWEELPVVKIGDFNTAIVYDKHVKGIPVSAPWRRFYWNTWLTK
ncbi:ABC transporter substrate-binding protein [Sediminispirochaeta smaragdinae]|uniref:Extracellular solute-binding protein family 5 n=1 Tax=Sediminispirochaeta smaragdinae (strain DSM 11293 / JCM 15392 / SEBR 4228) TaxID=573413 RepID=E1R708_SEDSS|nr:ABC transporter substrate-binding protein [Sediminispirochaeta smaragdinae]ADK81335.1 extracellular solute-binding protein family 5 [Sediminispirochaeta smaragdinae DSM 11293]